PLAPLLPVARDWPPQARSRRLRACPRRPQLPPFLCRLSRLQPAQRRCSAGCGHTGVSYGRYRGGSDRPPVIGTAQTCLALSPLLCARTKIFLYVKILTAFAASQLSLFTTLINKRDILTADIEQP